MYSGFIHGQVRVLRLEDLLLFQRQRESRPLSLFTDPASAQHLGCGGIHTLRAFCP
jgi:hypothetical protein